MSDVGRSDAMAAVDLSWAFPAVARSLEPSVGPFGHWFGIGPSDFGVAWFWGACRIGGGLVVRLSSFSGLFSYWRCLHGDGLVRCS